MSCNFTRAAAGLCDAVVGVKVQVAQRRDFAFEPDVAVHHVDELRVGLVQHFVADEVRVEQRRRRVETCNGACG